MVRTSGWVLLIVWWLVVPAVGQVSVGDYTKLNLSGYLGFGYSGGWDNLIGSSHSTSFVGDANLSGYYYHPNFVSFRARPYYNRNQANAVSQNIANTTGFDSAVNLFTGSRFPGSIGFSKAFNSAGEVGIPGTGFLSTDGSAQNFNITWSALLPKWPTLTATFTDYSNSASVLGTPGESRFSGRTFNLNGSYMLDGFQLGGFYNHQNFSTTLPEFIAQTTASENSTSSYGLSAGHKLPLSGNFSASWTRSSYDPNPNGTGGNTYDNVNLLAAVVPTRKLSLVSNVIYVRNLTGMLQQTLVDGGVYAPLVVDAASNSISINNQAFYTLGHGFGLQGYLNHRDQYFRGMHVSDTQYGGVVNYRYARPLFGMLYFNFGMFDTANQEGNSSLSFVGNVGLNRKWGRWDTSADFSYAQNVQTLISMYTTSNYSYGGYVRRRLGLDWSWQGSFRAAHSALTQHPEDLNRSETATAGFTWRRYTVTGNYSQSKGASVLSAAGTLVPTPIGDIFTPDVLYFNGRSYGVSLAATPFKRFTITGYYSNLRSDTLANSLFSFNSGNRYNVLGQYEFRRLQFRGGYTRTQQNISATSTLPAVVNSYFFNIARWFNIF